LPFCHVRLQGRRPLPHTYPQVLAIIGDHLRKRRLDLGLFQREVAQRLGVDTATITNWELGRTAPAIRFLPALTRFLGYNPYPPSQCLAERLHVRRRSLGWSQAHLAGLLGIDEGTITRWERGHRQPRGEVLKRLNALIGPLAP
jgi:transcriptional regulator with XRE-family HTH domain